MIPVFAKNTTIEYCNPYKSILLNRDFLIPDLSKYILSFTPDILFTQLDQSAEIIEIGQKYNIPTVLFIHDAEPLTIDGLLRIKNWRHIHVIFVSKYLKNKLAGLIHCPTTIIYPPFEKSLYKIAGPKTKHTYITMVNPVEYKGLSIIKNVIEKLPEKQFLLVAGWTDMQDLRYQFGSFKNVTLISWQEDPRNIFKKTRLLLMPSVWEEAFGRIATEAAINGIPVIASDKGGLREAIGNGGILIKDYTNISSWTKIIRKIDSSPMYYRALSKKSEHHAKKIFSLKYGSTLIHICENLIQAART